MLFRKRPVHVEAVRFTDPEKPPPGVTAALHGQFFVTTIQGVPTPVSVGEWVITESADPRFHYPCADAEFRRLYEPADAEAGAALEDGRNREAAR